MIRRRACLLVWSCAVASNAAVGPLPLVRTWPVVEDHAKALPATPRMLTLVGGRIVHDAAMRVAAEARAAAGPRWHLAHDAQGIELRGRRSAAVPVSGCSGDRCLHH